MLKNNQRIEVVDVLRGFAIMGIIIIHCLEHFDVYEFPEAPNKFITFTDKVIWDGIFFTFAGKAYATFALLFGFSFFVQDSAQVRRGVDFRPRFVWRMALLFIIGMVNTIFYSGDILVFYAIVGILLMPLFRLKTNVLLIIATIFMLQPFELGRIVYGIINPDHVPGPTIDAPFWPILGEAQRQESFWVLVKTNLYEGRLAVLGWYWSSGRFFQASALILFGLIAGRESFFDGSEKHSKLYVKLMIIASAVFFPLYGLSNVLSSFIESKAILEPLSKLITSLHKVAFMMLLVSSVLWLYYNTSFRGMLSKLAPYGRMSLTNYMCQSMLGTAIFFGWGLGMYKYTGATYSFLIGVGLLLFQYTICIWWLKRHAQGPFEYLWKKATWIKFKK